MKEEQLRNQINDIIEGGNIAWISDDGNRIQGSLTIEETHEMIRMIAYRLNSN